MVDKLGDFAKKVEKYTKIDNWNKARYFIEKALKISPNDHWFLTRLSLTYYEQYNYKKSLEVVKKALKLEPNCPLVLWDYAGTLDMLGHSKKAISIYNKLIKRNIVSLAYGKCGEGIKWAKSLRNDCLYRLALSCQKLGKESKAIEFYKKHLKNRRSGIPSIYPIKEVQKQLLRVGYQK